MYEFKILCENSKDIFEILHKILNPYTIEYAFYNVLKVCQNYKIFCRKISQISRVRDLCL